MGSRQECHLCEVPILMARQIVTRRNLLAVGMSAVLGGCARRGHLTPCDCGPQPYMPPAPGPWPPPIPTPGPGPVPHPEPEPYPGPDNHVRIRKGFTRLSSRELQSLERGVQVMKSRPKSDPTSWWYQANMHGYVPDEESTIFEAWGSCQHGNWWFLPWHRAYLLAFEQILRAASGDPELTLPYWDWTEQPQRALPDRFFDPQSPLFVENRLITRGKPIPDDAVRWEKALRFVPFASPGNEESFGGPFQPTPKHEHDRRFGALELLAHNGVHNEIDGWMGDPDTAGRDPIFWLHHANVDRLWGEWLHLGGGRRNPDDSLWLGTRFTFFDIAGRRIEFSASDVLDLNRLGYSYDKGISTQVIQPSIEMAKPQGRNVIKEFRAGMQVDVVATDKSSRILQGSPVTIPLVVEPTQRPKVTAALKGFQGRDEADRRVLRVVFDDVRYDTRPNRFYSVYLNLSQLGQGHDPNSPHFVGLITFFESANRAAMGHALGMRRADEARITFDITENLRELGMAGAPADSITITLVPSDARGGGAADPVGGAGPGVTLGRVSITATPE